MFLNMNLECFKFCLNKLIKAIKMIRKIQIYLIKLTNKIFQFNTL